VEIGTIEKFNINSNNLSEKERVLNLVSKDLVAFGQLFLPEDFMKSSAAPFHYEVGNKLLDRTLRKLCIVLPRGHSKSTMAKAALLHRIYFNPKGKKEFAAWVSEEQGQAVDHLKYIKNHIEYNNALNYYFGDMVGGKWTEKEITTSRGDRLIAKGTSQRLRGRSELGTRYTNIILDDFESELNTKTPDRRREIKEWLMSTVYPSLEESKGNEGSIWLIGTIVHYDSALQAIYDGYLEARDKDEDYTWDVIFHRALEDGKPLWESYFSRAKINQIRKDYENVGQLHKFAQEYMNDARDLATAKFKIDKLQHHDYEFVSSGNQAYIKDNKKVIPVNVYIGVDLAYESNAHNDFQVIMVTAVDSEKNFYILDYYHEHYPLYEMPQKIFEYAKMYSPVRRVNVEHVGAQGIIKDSVNKMTGFDRKMAPGIARGVRPPNGIKKEDRLESTLCPIVNRGKLFHRKIHQEIVDEMFHFPKGKNDDLLDGLWYSITNARSPLSKSFNSEDFDLEKSRENKKSKKSFVRSWITGQRA
tara:strand:+ start:3349 stop:4935 length:1587 start_codon:yes stop_codon:yes gene_type:complete